MRRYAGKRRKAFYGTRAWRMLRRAVLERDHYWCQVCRRRWANTVHHLIPVEERPDLMLQADNCQAICPECHNRMHPEKGGEGPGEGRMPAGIRVYDAGGEDGMG